MNTLLSMRLKVVPGRNWRGEPGWEWTCPPSPQHRRAVRGFTHEQTWTGQYRRIPAAQSRAMDGARRHLHRYHRDPP